MDFLTDINRSTWSGNSAATWRTHSRSGSGSGFMWNGTWIPMSDQNEGGHNDGDDAPPTGVREPRRPRGPMAPAAAAVPMPEMADGRALG